jgi:hypothetical protein
MLIAFTRFPELQALIQYCNAASIYLQETNILPTHTLNYHDFMNYHYDHLDQWANSGAAILFTDCIYCAAVDL